MGGELQGNLNAQLYGLQSSALMVFHDVTIASSGVSNCTLSLPSLCNNSVDGKSGLSGGEPGYLVGPGYDEVTGLGSLDVRAFLKSFTPSGAIVSAPQSPSFSVSGAALSFVRGASSGNTSAIAITPTAGFTGVVTLTAQIAASPAGAHNLPTISFGSTNPVHITGGNAGIAVMTVSTVADASVTAQSTPPPSARWYATGGMAMACLLQFGIPRRRSWRSLLSALALLAALAGGTLGCTAGLEGTAAASQALSGTTPGSYTITVTGTSRSAVVKVPITLIVQ